MMASQLTFPKFWTESSLDRYFTTEAMSKARDDFNEVHLSIDRILTDPAYIAVKGKLEMREVELLHLMEASQPGRPNRVFVVSGETGSGKSELCQWLFYNISNAVHVPILIPRSMIRLRDIVAQVHRHLNIPVPEETKDISELWPETVSAQLRAATLLYLQRSEIQNQIGRRDIDGLRKILDTREFEARMRHQFERYCEEVVRLERPRQLQLLPEPDFSDLAQQAGGLKDPSLCYRHIQHAMTDCLADQLGVDDLIEKLARISAAYGEAGKRPVLLIEDITTWGFLQNDLLDYLFDLSRGNFDVIIGVTTEFEQANRSQIYRAQQTISERIEARFELTDEQSETVFLRDHFVDMARLYLRAVLRASSPPSHLPVGFNQDFGPDLYPFNVNCLTNIYQSLQQEGNPKRTPRLFLRVLRQALEAERPPFATMEVLNNVDSPAIYFRREQSLAPETEGLFKWYGLNTSQGVFLLEGVASAFGVTLPDSVERFNGYYRLALRPGVELRLPPPPVQLSRQSHAPGPKAPTSAVPTPTPKSPAPAQEEPQSIPRPVDEPDVLVQMDNWLERLVPFPERNKLKDGILRLLEFYEFEPFRLAHPECTARNAVPLVFQRGEKYARIYLPDSGDDRPYPKLTIAPNPALSELFSQALAIGLGDYEVTNAERLDHAQLYDWLKRDVDRLQQQLHVILSSALGMPLEQFVLFCKFLLLNNLQGIMELDAQSLAQPVEGDPLQLPQVGQSVQYLYEAGPHIQGLFVAFFHFRENLVDYPGLVRVCQGLDSLRALDVVRRIDPTVIPQGFVISIGDDRLAFRDLVQIVQRYANSLWGIGQSGNLSTTSDRAQLQRLHSMCTPPDALDAEHLRRQIDELRTAVHRARISWKSSWDMSLQDLHKAPKSLDFPTVAAALDKALTRMEELNQRMNVFAYVSIQGLIRQASQCAAYDVLQAIDEIDNYLISADVDHTGPNPELDQRFMKFAEASHTLQKVVKA